MEKITDKIDKAIEEFDKKVIESSKLLSLADLILARRARFGLCLEEIEDEEDKK